MIELPDHLFRTYQSYKKKEEALLTWIQQAASQSGYVHEIAVPKQKQKLHGRERTLARRARQTQLLTNEASPTSHISTTQITLFDIIAPIQSICRNSQIKHVPEYIHRGLLSILELRKRCLAWYKQNTSQHDSSSRCQNANHEYPIHLLEQALSILKPKLETISKTTQSASHAKSVNNVPKKQQAHEMSSLFTHLSVEDISNSFDEGSHQLSVPMPTPDTLKALEKAMKDSQLRMQDEYRLAKFCLLQDMAKVEDFILLEYARYALDQMNGDVLLPLTNVAIDLVTRMETSLSEAFPDVEACERAFITELTEHSPELLTASPLLRMQEIFVKQLNGMACNDICRGLEETYFDRTSTDQALIEEAFCARMLLLPDLVRGESLTLCASNLSFRVVLEALVRRRKSSDGTSSITLANSFALRVKLLEESLLASGDSYSQATLYCTRDYLERQEAKRAELHTSPKYQSQIVVDRQEYLSKLDSNFREHLDNYKKELNDEMVQAVYGANKVTICENTHVLRVMFAITSIAALDVSNVARVLGDLWIYLKDTGNATGHWEDMNHLMGTMPPQFFFNGARPKEQTMDRFRNRILYTLGYREKEILRAVKDYDRYGGLRITKPVPRQRIDLEMFSLWHILAGRQNHHLQTYDIGTVNAELVANAKIIPLMLQQTPLKIVLNANAQIVNRKELWKITAKKPALTPTQLLAVVKHGLYCDNSLLDFDYTEFEKCCQIAVSRLFNTLCISEQFKVDNLQDLSTIDMLFLVVLFLTTCGDGSKLIEAGKVLDSFAEGYGDRGTMALIAYRLSFRGSTTTNEDLQGIMTEAIKRSGTYDDCFTEDQFSALNISIDSVRNLEDEIRGLWTN